MALQFAFGPNEAFFINSPQGAKASLNCPAPLREVLGGHYADSVRKIYRVTFSSRMECAAIYENGQGDLKFGVWDDGVNGRNTFGEMSAWLNNYSQDLHTLRLTCGSDDSLVAVTNHGRQNRGLPPDLEAYLQTNEKTMKLHEVIIGYGGAWVVIWENGCFDFQLSGQYPALEAALVPLRHQMAVGAISYLSLNSFAPNQYVLILATSPQPSFQVLPGWEGLAHEFAQSWHMSLQQRNANPISQISPAQNMSPIQRKPIQGTTLSNPQTAGPNPHTQPTQQQQFVSTPVAPPLQRVNTMTTTQPQPNLQEGGIPPQPHHNSISGPSPSTPIQLQNPSANLPSRPQSAYTMGSQTSAASIPSQNRRISTSSNSILRNVNSLVKTATPVVKKLATSAKNTVNNLNKPQQNQYHQQSSQQQYQHQLQQQMQHQLHHQQQLLHHQQQQLQQFQQQQSQQNQQQQSLFGTSDTSQLQNQGFSIDPSQASQFWSSGQSQPAPSPQQTSSPFSIAQPAPLQPAPVFLQNSLLPDQPSFVDSNSVFGAASTGSGTVAWADTTTTTVTDNGSIMDVDTTQVDVSSYMDPNTGFVEQDVSVVDVNTQFDDSRFGGGDSGFGGDGGW